MDNRIRRINLFAGPGAGKSTLATSIFAALKTKGHNIELVSEYVKMWAYQGKTPTSYDQIYLFAKQLHHEDTLLRHVPLIITDSPILLAPVYAKLYNFEPYNYLALIGKKFEQDFPALNLYIDRTVDYNPAGRYQDYEKALVFDKMLLDFLDEHLDGDLHHIQIEKFDQIMDLINSNLAENH